MIFVTIGTQIPFDRFIKIIDEIAETIDEEFYVQALTGNYKPRNFKIVDFINPDEFNRVVQEARLIISHAGIGSILSAMDFNKPIIIFPRLAKLKEHRNDHQIATAKAMKERNYAYVAYNQQELIDFLKMEELIPLNSNIMGNNNILNSILNIYN